MALGGRMMSAAKLSATTSDPAMILEGRMFLTEKLPERYETALSNQVK
jgi:hypothetical protein